MILFTILFIGIVFYGLVYIWNHFQETFTTTSSSTTPTPTPTPIICACPSSNNDSITTKIEQLQKKQEQIETRFTPVEQAYLSAKSMQSQENKNIK